uniref:Uncharacterized protein n=1 Tax=Chromera velia CCMP2878 TaxID=1169474 RepID=A0A0G4HZ86_9ALVE|eukprot:Cvel_33872.t1-p1 / transcript=Cvel_33872.t1 / gene=Cvel_33872 / organism=Chromera_velia_CCMP2878 / gene_product=Translation initiation factor IF-2, putative / transcript_product=Translation initiation factor IF-2, putative / location=Cvel_scaffold5641:857-3490(-) / protein_length=356 / sequence_SO=supercontig / SO=protein_coding / is_pseudo=false
MKSTGSMKYMPKSSLDLIQTAIQEKFSQVQKEVNKARIEARSGEVMAFCRDAFEILEVADKNARAFQDLPGFEAAHIDAVVPAILLCQFRAQSERVRQKAMEIRDAQTEAERRETVIQKGSRRKAEQSSSRKDSAQTGKWAGETEISAICSTLLMLQCSRPTLAKARTRTLKVPRPKGIALRVWRSKGITSKVLRPMGIAPRVLRSKGIALKVPRSRGIAPRVLSSKGIASRVLRSKGIAPWVLRSKGIASKVLRSQSITPRVLRPKGITPCTYNRVVSRVCTSSTSIRTVLRLQGSTNRTNKAEVDGRDEVGLRGEEVVGEPFMVPFEGPFEGHSEEVEEEGVELPLSPRIERET